MSPTMELSAYARCGSISSTRSLSTSDLSGADEMVEAVNGQLVPMSYDRNLNRQTFVNQNHASLSICAKLFPRKAYSLPHRYKTHASLVPRGGWCCGRSRDTTDSRPYTPVSPLEFRHRFTLMQQWFSDFSDEQRNIVLSELLEHIGPSQRHLLSVALQNHLHEGCPPNCEDPIGWLPAHLALTIFSYLDPASLARASQVCRAWNALTSKDSLWKRLALQSSWQLSPSSHRKQLKRCGRSDGTVQWKQVFIERFRLRRNWLGAHCHIRTFEGHTEGVSCVQFDEHRIVSGSHDNTIKVWNMRTNSPWSVQTLVGHSGMVRCLHLAGNRLVSGSADATIKVWDVEETSQWSSIACKVTMVGHAATVRCLQVAGDRVVSGSYDHTVKVWQLCTGECLRTLLGHAGPVLTVAFDETKIISGAADRTIKIWQLETGRCAKTLVGHEDGVTTLTFDDTRVISGSLDCTIRIWCVASGQCLGVLDWINNEGHTGVIRCLAADSWRIVSASDDKTIKVWDRRSGKRLVTLRNHTDGVTCLQFNDHVIVSGAYDKTVKLWDFGVC